MRKSMLGLILFGGVFFMLGAAPGSASAANCTIYNTGGFVYGSGAGAVIGYDATLNCTSVESVRWYHQPPGAGSQVGWYDYDAAAWAQGRLGGCGVNNNACSGDTSTYIQEDGSAFKTIYGAGVDVYQYANVWFYGACRKTSKNMWYQIKNSVTHTWGGYAEYFPGYYTNICVP